MKHFIYMDTYILNSYISQFNDGIVTNIHTEVTDATTSSKQENTTESQLESKFDLSIPGIFKTSIGNKDEVAATVTGLTQSQSGKELVDKLVHDNVFNQFIKYIEKNNLLKYNDFSIGDYISITGTFEFWDLDYLSEILNDDLIELFIKSGMNDLKTNGKLINKNQAKLFEKSQRDDFNYTSDIIKVCKNIMPFTKFMMMNGCFIPLEDKSLRESVSSIRFKYTGRITLIGQYTNDYKGMDIQQGITSAFSQTFNSLDGVINAFLKGSLNIPDNAKVITPIALYFE